MNGKRALEGPPSGPQSGDQPVPATGVAAPQASDARAVVLLLPLPTPSLNRFYGSHWARKAKERKKWGWLVRSERMRLKIFCPDLLPGTQPRRMTIDRYGPRILDHDNFVAGAKQLIDALVAEGFLVDDSPAHLTATYRQHVGKPYRTEVRIE